MIYILLEKGFEEAEAIVPADILFRGGHEVRFVGASTLSVKSARSASVNADLLLSDIDMDRMSALILPGGQPGVDNLWANTRVRDVVSYAALEGRLIGAICAAPVILGRLGLLSGRDATCYPGCEGELARARYLPDADVVTDSGIITARAAGDAFEFGFAVLRELSGAETAKQVAKSICYEYRG